MRYFLLVLLALGWMSFTTVDAQTCPVIDVETEIASHFGQIIEGSANNVRAEPSASADLLGQIPALAYVTISETETPICNEGYWWWRVRYGELEGWTVGYLNGEYAMEIIEPLEFGGVKLASASESPIIGEVVESDTFGNYIQFHAEGVEGYNWYQYFQMTVYNREEFAQISPINADRMQYLRYLLDERPDLSLEDTLPYVGGYGSAQVLHAQEAYIDLPNIIGIRYLTTYAQTTIPFTQNTLMYEFTGFTRNYRYAINLRIPVFVETLPAEQDESVFGYEFEQYDEYIAEMLDLLNADSFSSEPSLLTLDSLVGTIQIGATPILFEGAGSHFEPTYRFDWDYGACESEDFPSRLEVGMVVTSALDYPYTVEATINPNNNFGLFYDGAGWYLGNGDEALIVDGPACDGQFSYWLVYYESIRAMGWVKESGIFFEDELERYFLEELPDAELEMPIAFGTQAETGCLIYGALSPSVYAEPSSFSERYGSLVRGTGYYADAYYYPEEGGFQWWRLTAGASINDAGEIVVIDTPIWVLASSVVSSQACADVPTLTELP